jgi:SAM-dependent methyltransferase
MNEMSKALLRRQRDPNFIARYFVGSGIDIGCGNDPIGLYHTLFPLMTECQPWDQIHGHGDAQVMAGVPDNTYDWVASAHCLEHVHDPAVALTHWLRICKPGGHLILTFPDEDLYEQGVWPSTFNPDHKTTFTIHKPRSWSPKSVNVLTLLAGLGEGVQILKIELLDHANFYDAERFDQTMTPTAESAVEVILRKRPASEIVARGRFP